MLTVQKARETVIPAKAGIHKLVLLNNSRLKSSTIGHLDSLTPASAGVTTTVTINTKN